MPISAGHLQTTRIARGCAAATRFNWAFTNIRPEDSYRLPAEVSIVHYPIVFRTKNRESWIKPHLEKRARAFLGGIARENKMKDEGGPGWRQRAEHC